MTRDKEDLYEVSGKVFKAFGRNDLQLVNYFSEWSFRFGQGLSFKAIPDYNQKRFVKFKVPKEFME